MGEWQYSYRDLPTLPHEVYYQVLWTIRDLPRLRKITAGYIIAEKPPKMIRPEACGYELLDPVIAEALFRREAIEQALAEIPEEYRGGVLARILREEPKEQYQAHENTWKKWKQRFITRTAALLHLI